MENKEDIFNTIERYLQQKMTSAERADFEQELKHNSVIQQQYERHVAANELLLERRLLKIRAKTKAHTSKKASSGKTLLYGTAVVVCIALISSIFFFTTSTEYEEKDTIIADSIIINTTKQSKEKRTAVIIEKDSSAYDTLIKSVQKRDKTPESHVDLIYKKIQEKEKEVEKENVKKKASSDSVFQEQEKPVTGKATAKMDSLNVKKTISCNDYVLHFEVNTHNACLGKENGSVVIEIDNNKTAPYKVYIVNEFNELVNKNRLSEGSYSAYITDKNDCKSNSLGFFIEEELCLEDYLINTSYNEKFRLPVIDNNYHFKVYDKSGRMYYEQQVQEYEVLEWEGRNKSHEIIPGYYLIQLEFEDGTVKKGSITIQH